MNLDERIERLERESKQWRRISLCLAMGIAAMLACSQNPPTQPPSANAANSTTTTSEAKPATIRAHTIEFVDQNGDVTGKILTSEFGPSFISGGPLFKREGGFSIFPSRFDMSDKRGQVAIDSESIQVRDYTAEHGVGKDAVIVIGKSETRGGMIDVFNSLAKRVVSIQANKANSGIVAAYDLNGENPEVFPPR